MSFVSSTACDDARIRIWNVPDGGLKETCTEAQFSLIGKYSMHGIEIIHLAVPIRTL